jgi:hypothetical protein
MDPAISLIVAGEVHAAQGHTPADGILPDAGAHDVATPLDIASGADVDGQHPCRIAHVRESIRLAAPGLTTSPVARAGRA